MNKPDIHEQKTQHTTQGALIILDGWGCAPDSPNNAITQAYTPVMDTLRSTYAYTELQASGEAVGLPPNQDGNSEAGHMNIGAGRIIEQEATYINKQIASGRFFKNPAFLQAVANAELQSSKLHIMGLLSNHMSAHSYPDHLAALLHFCKQQGIQPYLHLFTDGRDAPPHEAVKLLKQLRDNFLDGESIATIMGRSYAMERNKRWESTELAYNAMVLGEGDTATSAEEAITRAYNRNESDEFIRPTVIDANGLIEEHDSVIFFNLRSDRARQITKAFVQVDFNEKNPGAFHRKKVVLPLQFVSMTDFGPDLDHIISAFPATDISDTLPLALKQYSQLYIAESEKYAHVTYFFNGGYDHAVNGEEWEKIASPADPDYTREPAMSARQIADAVINHITNNRYEFFVINFANADMLGHTGNQSATIQAVEALDEQIGRIVEAVQAFGGTAFITADHGNAEEMVNLETEEMDTEHSTALVPFIITRTDITLESGGCLANVVPTMLKVLNVPQPAAMTAKPLC